MARLTAEQRRRDFVEAAVRVIAAHGVAGATTRRIAEEAGVSLAALHYCYDSKEALFLAVHEQLATRVRVPELDGGGARHDLASGAVAALEQAIEWFRRHPEWARAELEVLFWALLHAPSLAGRSDELHQGAFERVLTACCGPHDDPALVRPTARLLTTLIDGLLLQWLAHGDSDRMADETEQAARVLRLYVASGAPPARQPPPSRRRAAVRSGPSR